VSGPAVGLVCKHGPDDHRLFRLCVVVADFADVGGHGAAVGQRVLMERVGTSYYLLKRLLAEAVSGGWLIVEKPGDSRRRTVYGLGPNLVMSRQSRRSVAVAPTESSTKLPRNKGQIAAGTLDGSNVGSLHRPPRKGGGATAVDKPASPYDGLPNWTAQRLEDNGAEP
jgi:hypothetical protein